MRPNSRTVALLALVAAGLWIGARDLARSDLFPIERQLLDFRVFYCAGRAIDQRADPYQVEPLRTCEHRVPNRLLTRSANLVLPFVLPGYDAVLFGALATLPFEVAQRIFVTLLLSSLAGAILLVGRTLRIPLLMTAAALGLSQFPAILFGQLAPLELLALAATAAALQSRREGLAGALAIGTLLEPQVGAFVVSGVAVLVPRGRLSLTIFGAVAALVAVLATSPGEQLSYVISTLPQHAVAEAHFQEQYSLSYGLTLLHVPDRAAVALGALWMATMLAVALAAGRAFARAGERTAVAFVPAACAVIGGNFVHLTQEGLAVPAALLLVRAAPAGAPQRLAGIALVLLAIPWPEPAIVKGVLVLTLLTWAILMWFLTGGSLRATAGAAAACCLVLWWIENHPPLPSPIPVVRAWPADGSVEAEWRAALGPASLVDPFRVGIKIPTWFGLIALTAAGSLFVRRAVREPVRT